MTRLTGIIRKIPTYKKNINFHTAQKKIRKGIKLTRGRSRVLRSTPRYSAIRLSVALVNVSSASDMDLPSLSSNRLICWRTNCFAHLQSLSYIAKWIKFQERSAANAQASVLTDWQALSHHRDNPSRRTQSNWHPFCRSMPDCVSKLNHAVACTWEGFLCLLSIGVTMNQPYEAAPIRETSAETRIIATDTINANVAATAPMDRKGFFSTSRAHRSQLTIRSLRRRPRVANRART